MTGGQELPTPQLQLVAMLLMACVPAGLIVYGWLIWLLMKKGGRVKTEFIALPDAMVVAVLAGFLIQITVKLALHPATSETPHVTAAQVLPNVAVFLGLLVLLCAFLYVRQINVRQFFGLHGLRPGRAFVLALGFIVSAFPLLMVTGGLTQHYLGPDAKEQDLVGVFREVVVHMDKKSIAAIVFAGALSQPVVEEVFFRGYFYVVAKKFFGGIASAIFVSALFAAVHFNLASFPALFILALCLTLAYEVTGSILVPIGMHALFNSSQLAFLAWQAHSIPPQ
jgi:membrane protease YdiL (CAAX protease family)